MISLEKKLIYEESDLKVKTLAAKTFDIINPPTVVGMIQRSPMNRLD